MLASFIIVNYNRKEEILLTISKTLETIAGRLSDFEIVVVDNASTDGSADAIRQQYQQVILIENPTNTGAPAWNLGFARATGKYFIILDDDSQIDGGLEGALSFLDDHDDVGVLALNITGGAFQTSQWSNLGEYAGFIGCGAIIKKELYDKIGGYADWIFLYTNEYEYGIRCLEAGYKILFYKDCHVTHRTSSINRTNKRLITFSVRNEMAIVYKYFSEKNRNLFLTRVYLNNLKGIYRYGFKSVGWYITALREFYKLKKMLIHTPVKPEVEKFYSENTWPTGRFFKII